MGNEKSLAAKSNFFDGRDRTIPRLGTPRAEVVQKQSLPHECGQKKREDIGRESGRELSSSSRCRVPHDVAESQVPRSMAMQRSLSAEPLTSGHAAFNLDARRPQSDLHLASGLTSPVDPMRGSHRRSASADPLLSFGAQLPLLLPPMPDLRQFRLSRTSPMVQQARSLDCNGVQRLAPPAPMAPPAPLALQQGSLLVPGPSTPARPHILADSPSGGVVGHPMSFRPHSDAQHYRSLDYPMSPQPSHAGGLLGHPIACGPQSRPDYCADLQQRSIDYSMSPWPSNAGVSQMSHGVHSGLTGSTTGPPNAAHVVKFADDASQRCIPPQRMRNESSPTYAQASMQDLCVSPVLQGSPLTVTRQPLRCQSDGKIFQNSVFVERGRGHGVPERGEPSHMDSFAVVCGPPSASAGIQAASPSFGVTDAQSVTRRMNDMLAMCRTRLAKSRRNAQDAEEKLHVVENDLSRIAYDWRELETELEVARYLFDSEAASEQRTAGSPTEKLMHSWRGGDTPPGTVLCFAAPEKVVQRSGAQRAGALLAEALRQTPQSPRRPFERSARHRSEMVVEAFRNRDASHALDDEACPPSFDELEQKSEGYSSVENSSIAMAPPSDTPRLSAKRCKLVDLLKPRVPDASKTGAAAKSRFRIDVGRGRN